MWRAPSHWARSCSQMWRDNSHVAHFSTASLVPPQGGARRAIKVAATIAAVSCVCLRRMSQSSLPKLSAFLSKIFFFPGRVQVGAAGVWLMPVIKTSTVYHKLSREVVMPLLRSKDPEAAHSLAIRLASWGLAPRDLAPGQRDSPALLTQVWGLRFDNPVGLAAGFDKQVRSAEAAFSGLGGPDPRAARLRMTQPQKSVSCFCRSIILQAEAIAPLLEAGFGFVEVGTVTPLPQPGNPRPRMFRLPEDRAVINRFGFNSDGAVAVADRLARFSADRLVSVTDPVSGTAAAPRGVLGVNIGKNKTGEAEEDYTTGIGLLSPFADYVTVNVSSPNTPGLRQLQSPDELRRLLRAVIAKRDRVFDRAAPPARAPVQPFGTDGGGLPTDVAGAAAPAALDGRAGSGRALDEALASARRRSLRPGAATAVAEAHAGAELSLSALATFVHRQLASDATGLRRSGPPPLLVKIAPDLTDDDVASIVAVALELGVDGLVVSNTTVARPATLRSPHAAEAGGLSGVPLMAPSTAMLRKVYAASGGKLPIIGACGGGAKLLAAMCRSTATTERCQCREARQQASNGMDAG